MKRPVERYRPTKTSDGEGGSTVVLGSATTLWGNTRVHEGRITFVCNTNESTEVEDILVIDTAQYRITGIRHVPGIGGKSLALERVEQPITP